MIVDTSYEAPKGDELLELYFRWCHLHATDNQHLQQLLSARAVFAWFKQMLVKQYAAFMWDLSRCKPTEWEVVHLREINLRQWEYYYPKILLKNLKRHDN